MVSEDDNVGLCGSDRSSSFSAFPESWLTSANGRVLSAAAEAGTEPSWGEGGEKLLGVTAILDSTEDPEDR